ALQAHNFNPIVALKVADGLSVAVGLQAQYMDISYENFQAAAAANLKLTGTGWAWGWTAGVTFTPFPQTQIGLGYRSAIDQELDGLLSSGLGVTTNGPITAILPLPDTVTVGLRQGIGDRFTLLAGFEWSNWSRIGTVPILRSTGGPALGATGSPITLPFQYEDGYFYSVGLEYCATPGLTLRAGFAYEESPVVDRVRTPRLPDNDRFWYSVGLTYKPPLLPGVLFDLAYSFIDVTDTPLTATAASGNPWFSTGAGIYTGISSSHISILSFGFRYRWDEPAVKRSAAFAK
ncbi:MAG: OmpP1/FadL family transporter, partial [Xanthobacteraceae bacterium]